MADITGQVTQIRQAIYGEEVRESIASSIEAMNEQCEESTAGYQQAITDAESALASANDAIENANSAAGQAQAQAQAAQNAASTANTAADRANEAAGAIEGTDLAVRVQTLEGEMDTAQRDIATIKGVMALNPIPMEPNVAGTCYLLEFEGYHKVVIDIIAKPENGLLVTLPVPPALPLVLAGPMALTDATSATNVYLLQLQENGDVVGVFSGDWEPSESAPLHIEFGYIG